jgi:xanthine dehydrogenase accessory factor
VIMATGPPGICPAGRRQSLARRGKLGSMGNEQDSLDESAACEVAHGHGAGPGTDRTLIAAFASPVADFLLHFAGDAGYRVVLLEPDPDRAASAGTTGYEVTGDAAKYLDATADLVVTDHHRPELGVVLRDALASPARWVGIMGNPRHQGPHIEALAELGVAEADIARVHRPIGLNIGSRTPPEIAIATLAGLIADRNGRPGGFSF